MTDRATIIIRAVEAVMRLVMGAATHRDAEAIVHQLEAMGPARKADVDRIERDARGRIAPELNDEERARVGGPLDGGD